jgi:hypothetical protein
VNDGTGLGRIGVLVGMTFVFTRTGEAVTSTFEQDTRNKNRRTAKICFIALRHFHREDAKNAKELLY